MQTAVNNVIDQLSQIGLVNKTDKGCSLAETLPDLHITLDDVDYSINWDGVTGETPPEKVCYLFSFLIALDAEDGTEEITDQAAWEQGRLASLDPADIPWLIKIEEV